MSHDAHFTHAHMVRFDWPLPATPDKVWAVLTDFTRLPGWYGNGMLEGKVGGAVRLMGSHIRGTVTQWQPPRKLSLQLERVRHRTTRARPIPNRTSPWSSARRTTARC